MKFIHFIQENVSENKLKHKKGNFIERYLVMSLLATVLKNIMVTKFYEET